MAALIFLLYFLVALAGVVGLLYFLIHWNWKKEGHNPPPVFMRIRLKGGDHNEHLAKTRVLYSQMFDAGIPFCFEIHKRPIGEGVFTYFGFDRPVLSRVKLIFNSLLSENEYEVDNSGVIEDWGVEGMDHYSAFEGGLRRHFLHPMARNDFFKNSIDFLSALEPVGEGAIFRFSISPHKVPDKRRISDILDALDAGSPEATSSFGAEFLYTPEVTSDMRDKLNDSLFAIRPQVLLLATHPERLKNLETQFSDLITSKNVPSFNNLLSYKRVGSDGAWQDFFTTESIGRPNVILSSRELSDLLNFGSRESLNRPKMR